jgi:hypothetical protein
MRAAMRTGLLVMLVMLACMTVRAQTAVPAEVQPAAVPVVQSEIPVTFKGAAWMQFGRIEHSSDRVTNGPYNNFNQNWQQAAGMQISSSAVLAPGWNGAFGIGTAMGHNARGDVSVANNWYPTWNTFVSEARLTHNRDFGDAKAQWTIGFFPYNYNPEVRNLGLYLLRGNSYPGVLLSGFEARHVSPAANIFGTWGRITRGNFTNDLLVISETDLRPYFDVSVANVVTWQAHPSLQLGAGVNLYRVLPRNGRFNSPGKHCDNTYSNYTQIDPTTAEGDNCAIFDTTSVDTVAHTATVDTVTGSLQSTKVMGRFRFDPKTLFGIGTPFGKQDLVLYGEAALIGFKNYPKYYEKASERMPMMLGLNLPAFGWLDRFALEVEYFGSKNYSDYGKTETYYAWTPRVVPVNTARDDWKWSLYASRVVAGNLRLSGQVANDHLRTFGAPDLGYTTYAEALSTPRDWYWMLKLTAFF